VQMPPWLLRQSTEGTFVFLAWRANPSSSERVCVGAQAAGHDHEWM
jgi:hypothetical protein